jgi:hypothetical protein
MIDFASPASAIRGLVVPDNYASGPSAEKEIITYFYM